MMPRRPKYVIYHVFKRKLNKVWAIHLQINLEYIIKNIVFLTKPWKFLCVYTERERHIITELWIKEMQTGLAVVKNTHSSVTVVQVGQSPKWCRVPDSFPGVFSWKEKSSRTPSTLGHFGSFTSLIASKIFFNTCSKQVLSSHTKWTNQTKPNQTKNEKNQTNKKQKKKKTLG